MMRIEKMDELYDVIVIGAGAVGCAVARELSRYQLRILVLEKEADVAAGASGRNSAVVHAGFNNRPGSRMAELCVEGNKGFEALCRELDVPYKKTGKFVVALDEEDRTTLGRLMENGQANGCPGLRLLGEQELRERVPGVAGIAAMESPETAIFDPFLYTVALAENAAANGAAFRFESEVTGIRRADGRFFIETAEKIFESHCLVNCAGVYSDRIAAMAGIQGYTIYPCRGEYILLDKVADSLLDIPVYPTPKPGDGGLGIHLTPTVHGNVLLGPSAEYIGERDDVAATGEVFSRLLREARQLLPTLDPSTVIGTFSGIRPKQAPPDEGGFWDFVLRDEPDCPGFLSLVGIESPGLTASLPIARRVCSLLRERLPLVEKANFSPARTGIVRFRDLSPAEQAQRIAEDPEYGEILCRCQQVTKREVRDAVENPLGVRTLAGIKYRAWATTGRCQGGYCLARITELLVKEYGMEPATITKCGVGSELFAGRVK